MSPTQRIEAVLAGRRPDRPPYSFWCHFLPIEAYGQAAVDAHLRHLETFGLDFLKVMNDNGYPHDRPIQQIDDLNTIGELSGNETEFGRQLELIAALHSRLKGSALTTTTIFNPWAVLRSLIQTSAKNHDEDWQSEWIRKVRMRNAELADRALEAICLNLRRFARQCIDAGADGIFLSTRDDWVDGTRSEDAGLYRQVVRPLDLSILEAAAKGRFNMLHVCGKAKDFKSFGEFPVQVINWADRSAGPSICEVKGWLKPAICAGINHERTLLTGSPDDVRREITDAISQAGDRPIILAPGCTYDPTLVPQANLHAIAQAVKLRQ